ncbi:MAG: aminopeptidase, partial [Brachybacterium alimentarium]
MMTSSTWTLPGLHLTDLTLPVPLDHARPDSPTIELFARIVAEPDGQDRPFLVFLQGGPGSEA